MATASEETELSKQYATPLGLAHSTMQALKDRIKLHYDLASDYYLNLWYVCVESCPALKEVWAGKGSGRSPCTPG